MQKNKSKLKLRDKTHRMVTDYDERLNHAFFINQRIQKSLLLPKYKIKQSKQKSNSTLKLQKKCSQNINNCKSNKSITNKNVNITKHNKKRKNKYKEWEQINDKSQLKAMMKPKKKERTNLNKNKSFLQKIKKSSKDSKDKILGENKHKLSLQTKNISSIEKRNKLSSQQKQKSHLKCQQSYSKDSLKNNRTTKCSQTQEYIQIINKCGEGTFGEVFKVKVGQKILALKRVIQDSSYKNRELQILSQIQHQFLPKVHKMYFDKKQTDVYLNILSEFYPYSMDQINKNFEGLELKLVLYQLLKVLVYLHANKICHRDIKPHNLLYDPEKWKLSLCDFGSAKKILEGQASIAYIGSRNYRAPQLIFGNTFYNSKIDMWAVGCVFIEIINNKPLFSGTSNIDLIVEIINILGSPTELQIKQMNPNNQTLCTIVNFPYIKGKSLTQVTNCQDEKLLDLLEQLLVYSPLNRLTAGQALAHEYFDEIRIQKHYKQLLKRYSFCKQFFTFTNSQIQNLPSNIIPKWLSQD